MSSLIRTATVSVGAVVLAFAFPGTARAQHAADDPVASATDSFGLTLGLESIGLYGPGFVRGFNPQTAGNVRIDGLYFDQQGALSNRVVEGSAIRIGVSEIGYAFPAPTGIVDYELRRPGGDVPNATLVVSAGPFQARGASVDGSVPLVRDELRLPLGVSYQTSTQTQTGIANPGYTATIANFGATPQWTPADRMTIRGIVDWTQTTSARTLPFVLTGGDYQPPRIHPTYLGQNWAEGRSIAENFGGIITARLTDQWSLRAAVFRSVADNPVSYADLYVETQPNGSADHVVIGYPDQFTASNSGEARLSGHFGAGPWRQDVVFLARGRDTLALYGGSDVVDVGSALIGQGLQVPRPDFAYATRTHDRTELWGAGVAYRAQWKGTADFALGVQRESYTKDVVSPGLVDAYLTDHPVRAYTTAALALNERATAYAGYTQGLEDSGVVPSSADNRGAILPDARTWQTDAGLRYLLTSRVKLIAGVFEIEKPYFNLDTHNVDRALGLQRADGLELSLSGEVLENLNVTAAALWGEVKVLGADLKAEGIGPVPLNQDRITTTLNASYRFAARPAWSADITIFHFGSYPASIDDVAQASPGTAIALGGRYRFKLLGAPATLRVQVQNLTNAYFWNPSYSSPSFSQYEPRAYFGYLTADF